LVLQVIRLQNTLKAIEILELFLEMIRTRIEYLAKLKEIPSEMRSSILSVAYASTRLTDITELAGIRKSFESKFGREVFAEVTKGDPGPASGVQEALLKCLSVHPPNIPAKVSAAEAIMQQLGIEWDVAELERVSILCMSNCACTKLEAIALSANTCWVCISWPSAWSCVWRREIERVVQTGGEAVCHRHSGTSRLSQGCCDVACIASTHAPAGCACSGAVSSSLRTGAGCWLFCPKRQQRRIWRLGRFQHSWQHSIPFQHPKSPARPDTNQ
jgi:hypothetical protein